MGSRSLALDAAGHPHIAYGQKHLYYAWHDGTSWHYEIADPSWHVGIHTALALDSAGYPHISYSAEYPAIGLRYAYFDGTSWITETIDSTEIQGYTDLALDSAGYPHISYWSSDNSTLNYAHFDGTSWLIETIDSTWTIILYNSLALDAAGRPHISYYDYTNYDLMYARFDGTSWLTETIAGAGDTGRGAALALDAAGQPHISYYDADSWDLRYAWAEWSGCVPVAGASIAGPAVLPVGEEGWYTATYSPPYANSPVSFFWDNSTVGPDTTYQWSTPGLYTVTVTAANACGTSQGVLVVQVQSTFTWVVYIPLVFSGYNPAPN